MSLWWVIWLSGLTGTLIYVSQKLEKLENNIQELESRIEDLESAKLEPDDEEFL